MKKMLIKQFHREMEASGFPWGKKKVDPAGHLTGSPGSELSEKTVRFNAPRSPGQSLLHQPVVTTQRKAQVLPPERLRFTMVIN